MSLKTQFVELAALEGANIRALCRQFQISPQTGYKWRRRFQSEGLAGLGEKSRKPLASPSRISAEFEKSVIELRSLHPAWGARKIRQRLSDLGATALPAVSTVHAVLRRHRLLGKHTRPERELIRFEKGEPNELWQMDFKGCFQTGEGSCYPLTILDDHSRYSLAIRTCAAENGETVRKHLTEAFRLYGLPRTILCDNGNPWGASTEKCPVTSFGIWLWRLGINITHGRPRHPQTQGKLERFHRSLKAEVLTRPSWESFAQCQRAFDGWRHVYNHQRPHQALEDKVPASRYRASLREMPDKIPGIEYDQGVLLRKVMASGAFHFKSRFYFVGRAFAGYHIGLIRLDREDHYEVRFGWKKLSVINLAEHHGEPTRAQSVWSHSPISKTR